MSSVMREDPETFKVWIAILASCKEDGIARVSSVGLSSHCYLSLESVKRSLDILMSPDSESRSLNDDGRRIRRVDGGYEVVNYLKYRERQYSDNPDAVRKRKLRANKANSLGHFGTCPGHSASASASETNKKEIDNKLVDPKDIAEVVLDLRKTREGIKWKQKITRKPLS